MSISNLSKDQSQILQVNAPAKVNLHLEVLGLRSDGFHELAMVMQSIDLADCLRFANNEEGLVSLTIDDPTLSAGDENLIVKAANLLRSFSDRSDLGAAIHLQKNIPIGAGLAGGSSDAAAALKGLNSLWKLGIEKNQLMELAADLGSDVPFCMEGGTQLCFGRGERLEPLSTFRDSSMSILLIKDPLVSVSTPWAYGRCKEIKGNDYLSSEIDFEKRRQKLRNQSWLRALDVPPLYNDLQQIIEPELSAVENALKLLASLPGSDGVAMSGSGPSCFALYPSLQSAKTVHDEYKAEFEALGVESWCCPFKSQGVSFFDE